MTAAILATGLTKVFPSGVAVDRLTFELPAGSVLALLGPNGAGKTTTVRLLNGVLSPDGGLARVAGFDPATEGDEVRRRTGVLTENAGLDDRLTTRENLLFTARIRGYDRAEAERRTDEMLARFGMADRAGDLTQGFSTGQRKRVALARALLHGPEVLFLDEPTSGLDPAGTRDVIELIQSLSGEGRTIILATHFLFEAGQLADYMAVMHRGQLHAYGTPTSLANDLFDGIGGQVDLGGPASDELVATAAGIDGVLRAESDDLGITMRLRDREVLPHVVAAAVARGDAVYGVKAHEPTLEDVYFKVEQQIIETTGDRMNDSFLVGDSGDRP